jgi:hypothetical protein
VCERLRGAPRQVNCHLSAGDHNDAPRKRLQQLHDGLTAAAKQLTGAGPAVAAPKGGKQKAKAKAGAPPDGALVVCGDFNSDAREPASAAAGRYMALGAVEPAFREPTSAAALTSKRKAHRFGTLANAAGVAGAARWPTYIAQNLFPRFLGHRGPAEAPTAALVAAVGRIFAEFCGAADALSAVGLRAWLTAVNGRHDAVLPAPVPVPAPDPQPGPEPVPEPEAAPSVLEAAIAAWRTEGFRGSEFREARAGALGVYDSFHP